MRALVVPAVASAMVLGCSGPKRPTAPPPEYEAPRVTAWDAAAPVDPLENLEGEVVTDEPVAPEAPPDAAVFVGDGSVLGAADASPEAG